MLPRLLLVTVCLLLGGAAASDAVARTWYVDPRASRVHDGTSWRSAWPELAPALDAAQPGDEVWCAAGAYAVTHTLTITSGITVRGGFTGSEASPAAREHVLTSHATVIRVTTPGESVMSVVNARAVLLDGLTLTGARGAAGLRVSGCGEGIELRQCRIEQNTSSESGAGVTVSNGSRMAFFGCKISDNTLESSRESAAQPRGGAGVYVDASSSTTWTACVFSGNVANAPTGGGVRLRSRPELTNRFVLCDFYFNEAAENGSALETTGRVELRDCVVASNLLRRSPAAEAGAILLLGDAAHVTLSGQTYVVGNVGGENGAVYTRGVDGKVETRDQALVADQAGVADPLLWASRNDLHLAPRDLLMPPLTTEPPAAGRWVRQTLPAYAGTAAYHCVYLPTDWRPGRKYPVLVGFPGNGPYRNRFGDRSGGMPEDNEMAYGISGGRGFIVLSLGYLDSRRNLAPTGTWWGDVKATIAYAKAAVAYVGEHYGGAPEQVVLTGFSRSAIGASFVGLHDDDVARLWRAFICYDGWEAQKDMARDWYKFDKNSFNYDPADFGGTGVARRFARLAGRPVYILGGRGEAAELNAKQGFPIALVDKPHRNHNTSWALRDTPEREQIRAWLTSVLPR